MKMKEEIKEVIDGLWDKIYLELERFDKQYIRLDVDLEMKRVGKAMISIKKCRKHLEAIDTALDAIGMLEGLLEDEYEDRD